MPRTDLSQLDALKDRLTGGSSADRLEAREELAALGEAAVPALMDAARGGATELRREALKTLQLIGAARAEPLFFAALEDDDPVCRWLAAEGLVGLGEPVLERVLTRVVDGHLDERLERGLHHVLFELGHTGHGNLLAPVLAAFHSDTPGVRVPLAAHEALLELRGSRAPR